MTNILSRDSDGAVRSNENKILVTMRITVLKTVHREARAYVLAPVPKRSLPTVKSAAIPEHQRNHPESEPKRLPEIAGDRSLQPHSPGLAPQVAY